MTVLLEEAVYRNVLSVPDGAPAAVKKGAPDPGDRKFEYLANCAEQLHRLERITLRSMLMDLATLSRKSLRSASPGSSRGSP